MLLCFLVDPRRTVGHYGVTTASGEDLWEGSPEEIVKEMVALDYDGDQSDFMAMVCERISQGFLLPMMVTDNPLTFLHELARLRLITLEHTP
jgi:hypothetical protein